MYCRTGIQIVISLYAVRILLQNLGIYDYGVYNTIGSVVVMSSFITSALSSSTQRYISYALGENDIIKLSSTVKISQKLHLLLAIIVLMLCEIVGYIFVYYYMNIEDWRRNEVYVVLQFSILTFFINVILVPYRAVLIAYERFDVISVATVVESVNKLFIAWIIGLWWIYSKLTFYSFLFVIVTIISFLIHYCFFTKYNKEFMDIQTSDSILIKGMLGFSGWNFLGGMGQVLVNQLSNMFLNVFCGPVVNAAQGVAMQVNGVVSRFVQDFMSAISPQITKSFSAKDYEYLDKVVYSSIKLSFFLIFAISVPLVFNIEYILSLWLKEVPEYVPSFIRLLMINSCIISLTGSISSLVEANGKIKFTQINYTVVMILTTLGCFILLKNGYPPCVVYYMLILSTIGSMIVRLFFATRYKLIRIGYFFKVLVGGILPFVVCYIGIYYLLFVIISPIHRGLNTLVLSIIVSLIFLPIYGYYIYLSQTEKQFVISLVRKKS